MLHSLTDMKVGSLRHQTSSSTHPSIHSPAIIRSAQLSSPRTPTTSSHLVPPSSCSLSQPVPYLASCAPSPLSVEPLPLLQRSVQTLWPLLVLKGVWD